MYYLTDLDPRPQGWAGVDSGVGSDGSALLAIDYKTGKIVWSHEWPGGGGLAHTLSTAGKLLFTHNGNNIIAFDPSDGKHPVALDADGRAQRGADHLHHRRQAVSAGLRGRWTVCLHGSPAGAGASLGPESRTTRGWLRSPPDAAHG